MTADLPGVGENLRDHPAVTLTYATGAAPPGPRDPVLQTFLTCDLSGGDGASDLQVLPSGPETDEDGATVLTLWAALLRPSSRGRLWLRSADPVTPHASTSASCATRRTPAAG